MWIEHDRGSSLRSRLLNGRRQCSFGGVLDRLIDREHNRLTGASGNFGAFIRPAPGILFDEKFARLAGYLFVINLFDSGQAVAVEAHIAKHVRGEGAVWIKTLRLFSQVDSGEGPFQAAPPFRAQSARAIQRKRRPLFLASLIWRKTVF